MSIGLKYRLGFHDKRRITDAIERASCQEFLNHPCDNFLLVASLFFVNKGNDSLVLINFPIIRVKVKLSPGVARKILFRGLQMMGLKHWEQRIWLGENNCVGWE